MEYQCTLILQRKNALMIRFTLNFLPLFYFQTAELLDIVRTTGKERDVLRQEVTFLRRIVSTSSDPTAALVMPPLEPLSPTPIPPAEDAEGILETGRDGKNQEELEVGMSAAVLANDSVFRDVTVAPGVTLLQLYSET